jgi:hypothetical protein
MIYNSKYFIESGLISGDAQTSWRSGLRREWIGEFFIIFFLQTVKEKLARFPFLKNEIAFQYCVE